MIKEKLFLLLFSLGSYICYANNDSISYSVHIIDYSNSYEYNTHYVFDNEGIKIYEEDKLKMGDVAKMLSRRQLLGKEKVRIKEYLSLLSQIEFGKEYTGTNDNNKGERNQKRVSFTYNGLEQSILISNFYQKELADFIVFLNNFLKISNKKILEFTPQ